MATLLILEFGNFVGDDQVNFAAGDEPAIPGNIQSSRSWWEFPNQVAETAIISKQLIMPSQYTGSGLVGILHGFFETEVDAGETATMEVYVEAVNPNTSTLDMQTAKSWDTLNEGDVDPNNNTAGDPVSHSVSLANDDSVAVGWDFRLGVRRNTSDGNDTATDSFMMYSLEIADDG